MSADAEVAAEYAVDLKGRGATLTIPGLGSFPLLITEGRLAIEQPDPRRLGRARVTLAATSDGWVIQTRGLGPREEAPRG